MSIINNFKNTDKYLDGYARNILIRFLREEIERPRDRYYPSGTINSPIDSSGDLARTLSIEKDGMTFNIMGNDYGLKVDKGTNSTRVSLSKIQDWIKQKPVRLSDNRPQTLKKVASRIKGAIETRGIYPTGFIKDAVDNAIKLLKLGEPVKKDIIENIQQILIDAGFAKKGDSFIIE